MSFMQIINCFLDLLIVIIEWVWKIRFNDENKTNNIIVIEECDSCLLCEGIKNIVLKLLINFKNSSSQHDSISCQVKHKWLLSNWLVIGSLNHVVKVIKTYFLSFIFAKLIFSSNINFKFINFKYQKINFY